MYAYPPTTPTVMPGKTSVNLDFLLVMNRTATQQRAAVQAEMWQLRKDCTVASRWTLRPAAMLKPYLRIQNGVILASGGLDKKPDNTSPHLCRWAIVNKLNCQYVVSSLFIDHVPTTYRTHYRPHHQPHTNHVPTTYQPHTKHILTDELLPYRCSPHLLELEDLHNNNNNMQYFSNTENAQTNSGRWISGWQQGCCCNAEKWHETQMNDQVPGSQDFWSAANNMKIAHHTFSTP